MKKKSQCFNPITIGGGGVHPPCCFLCITYEDAQALASPGKIVVIEIVSLNILVLLRNVDKCENMIIKMFFIKTFIF